MIVFLHLVPRSGVQISFRVKFGLDLQGFNKNKFIWSLSCNWFTVRGYSFTPNPKPSNSWTKSAFLWALFLLGDITCEQTQGSSISHVTHNPWDEPCAGMNDSVCPILRDSKHKEIPQKKKTQNVDLIQNVHPENWSKHICTGDSNQTQKRTMMTSPESRMIPTGFIQMHIISTFTVYKVCTWLD